MIKLAARLALPDWIRQEIDAHPICPGDEAKVALAIRLSALNVERGTGGPFGAAVFDADDRLVSVGVNRVVPEASSIAHAEMMAYLTAQASTGRNRLNEGFPGIVLATSSQPCCMCYGATFWAGIDTLLIGASATDVMELTEFDEGPLPADWRGELRARGIAVREGIERQAARDVLAAYSRVGGGNY
ncbi:nucleoside deaminase [Xanthomonadaceae bacterium JHOS43]|nr:nucleoside deaminase [Xanthomonadaceae bacterium JHOS43]